MSKVNKAFDYDGEKSIQNVTKDIDVRPEDESGSDSGLNYDKILEEIKKLEKDIVDLKAHNSVLQTKGKTLSKFLLFF